MESLVRSEFDSEALQVNVAKLSLSSLSEEDLRKALNLASKEKFQVVFLNALLEDSKAVQQFAQRSGHYCAVKVTYRILLNESLISALGHYTKSQDIREFDGDVPCSKLIELSKHAGGESRFMNDPNMSHAQFESVYSAWMHNSVTGKVADVVLTAWTGSSISGMVTVKIQNSDVVSIGLLAVDPQHRRLGIGVALVVSALSWALDRGRNICEIATQETNQNARQLYEKCGGILTLTSMDFHFWLGTTPFNDPVMNSNIPYNVPYITGGELANLHEVFESKKVATHGKFGKQCQERLQDELGALKVLLVTSGTSALELCSLAINTVYGDEIIMPSYTFVSTATAFVNHGGVPVFVDIRRDTQNIDETKIEEAITEKTKAIVVVHYAGVPCEMETIMSIASRYNLFVIEDNAHGIFSTYKGKPLGSIGHLGAHSFHYTKNLSCGEGGAVFVNTPELIAPSMIAWEKGTNRFDFLSGKVDKYAWVDRGSSFILSEINASVLAAQVRPHLKV
jgi:GNAT superfamily N-acetyltransferase